MMTPTARIAYMADQIARNFATLGQTAAVVATADHVATFWDPRMKSKAMEMLAANDASLTDVAKAAFVLLRDRGAPPPQTRATEFNAVDDGGHADAG